jgi:hypothetical protein
MLTKYLGTVPEFFKKISTYFTTHLYRYCLFGPICFLGKAKLYAENFCSVNFTFRQSDLIHSPNPGSSGVDEGGLGLDLRDDLEDFEFWGSVPDFLERVVRFGAIT